MIAAEISMSMFESSAGSVWNNLADMEEWCLVKFGSEARERDQVSDEYPWCTRYNNGVMWWYFAREEYATLFALRWL